MVRRVLAGGASLALCIAAPAQAAAPPPCLTQAEMHGLIGYFLPDVLGKVVEGCSTSLPPSSYLRGDLSKLTSDLAARKPALWPVARTAFLKMGDQRDSKEMAALPDEALRPLIDAVLVSKLAIAVTPAACGEVNDIAEALSPLSPDQTVHLLATIFSAVARNDNKLRSCPRSGR